MATTDRRARLCLQLIVAVFIVIICAAIAGEAAVVPPVWSDEDDTERLYKALLANRHLSNDAKFKLLVIMAALNALASDEPLVQPPDASLALASDGIRASDSLENPIADGEAKRSKFLYLPG